MLLYHNVQSAVSCIERGRERSRENQKEYLQYLAAGAARTAIRRGRIWIDNRQDSGIVNVYSAALFLTFIRAINWKLSNR